MNIKFSTYSKKSGLQQLIVRLYYGRFDLSVKLDLFVAESDWNEALQLTNSSLLVNEKLLKLKSEILAKYNEDYVRGVLVNKQWLSEIVSNVFNRPSEEKKLINSDASIYLVEFANEWLKTKSANWKISHNKFMNKTLKGQYQNTVDLLAEFEQFANYKIVLKDLKTEDFYAFIDYLQNELDYNISTIERILSRMRFFCNRALECGLKVSKSFQQRIYLEKEEEIDNVYLTEKEISKICKLDLSADQKLDNIKDAFLLGLFTGMRFSDYGKRLDISNFKNGFIKITTQKTSQRIVVPVHRVVSEIIKKRNGNLPSKVSLHEFNLGIRTICMICDIDEMVYGKLFDSATKRKKVGMFRKYQLISSHSARRGFATLYADKLSENAICSILGWSSAQMLKIYNQTSKEDYALELQKIWENGK